MLKLVLNISAAALVVSLCGSLAVADDSAPAMYKLLSCKVVSDSSNASPKILAMSFFGQSMPNFSSQDASATAKTVSGFASVKGGNELASMEVLTPVSVDIEKDLFRIVLPGDNQTSDTLSISTKDYLDSMTSGKPIHLSLETLQLDCNPGFELTDDGRGLVTGLGLALDSLFPNQSVESSPSAVKQAPAPAAQQQQAAPQSGSQSKIQ